MLVCFLWWLPAAVGNTDSLLNLLQVQIEQREKVLERREAAFAALHEKIRDGVSLDSLFAWQLQLCTLCQSFSYQRAAREADLLAQMARRSKDPFKVTQAVIQKAFICLSAGFFREALDSLQGLSEKVIPPTLRPTWFHTQARCHLDMAAYYADPFYAPLYRQKGLALLDSALHYIPANDTL
jgi:hypothetical protein